jgi:DNA polymerase-3 subunit epsilon
VEGDLAAAAARYRRAPQPAPSTPWRAANFAVVDLELTGLDPRHDEILSYAVVPVAGGRAIVGESLEGWCRPRRPVPPASAVVHGLRTADLERAPTLDEALPSLLDALTSRIVVAHDARVEGPFLSRALRRARVRLRRPVVDTLVLAQLLAREEGTRAPVALGELAGWLGLPVHRPHEALGDALTTAQVLLALATRLDARHPETVASLAAALRRLALAEPRPV